MFLFLLIYFWRFSLSVEKKFIKSTIKKSSQINLKSLRKSYNADNVKAQSTKTTSPIRKMKNSPSSIKPQISKKLEPTKF